MKGNIDFEKLTPFDVYGLFPKVRKKMLKNKILAWRNKKTGKILKIDEIVKTPLEEREWVIPSFKCIITKKNGDKRANYYPFYFEIFRGLLAKMQDIDFAISELKMYENNFYTFGNGSTVELNKRKEFNFNLGK